MKDVVVGILSVRDVHVEAASESAAGLVTEEQDLVIVISEVTALGTIQFSDFTISGTTRSIVPSGPPVVTGVDGCDSNLIAHIVFLEGFHNDGLATRIGCKHNIVDEILGNSSTGRRIEVGSIKLTRTGTTAGLQAELPSANHFTIDREGSLVVVEVNVVFHIEPCIVRALKVVVSTPSSNHCAVIRVLVVNLCTPFTA